MDRKYTATFVRVARGIPGMLYQPVIKNEKSKIAFIAMHPEGDYLDRTAGPYLASKGYIVLLANSADRGSDFPVKIAEVGKAMSLVRSLEGVEKVILIGHSGGATLMSAYQAIAENTVKYFQGDNMLVPAPDYLEGLIPADGFASTDSNWGNGSMRLFSTDPAVMSEDGSMLRDPELDAFNPANGWAPCGAHYTQEFLKRFFNAQHERNMRIVKHALDRLAIIESGRGYYSDDEPFIIPGASQHIYNNKLFPQDISLMSSTKEKRNNVKNGGRVDVEVVKTVRKARFLEDMSQIYGCAYPTTVKTFLSTTGVFTDPSYHYTDCEVFGIHWENTYNCTPGNVKGVSCPTIVLGMTASWEFASAETIYQNSAAKDKHLAFIEGADHDFYTAKDCERFEGEFGNTTATMFDYLDKWVCEPGRFL